MVQAHQPGHTVQQSGPGVLDSGLAASGLAASGLAPSGLAASGCERGDSKMLINLKTGSELNTKLAHCFF